MKILSTAHMDADDKPTGEYGGSGKDIPLIRLGAESIHLTAIHPDRLAGWLRDFARELETFAKEVESR